MACPNCGSEDPAEVVIEERYDGVYDPDTQETTVDCSCCQREITVLCPACGEDYPSTALANFLP